uniref:Uncharacterized protein n=1 Tax=Salix viminalis TaxID=40686 RepID=A0A6N2MEI0_SALVM
MVDGLRVSYRLARGGDVQVGGGGGGDGGGVEEREDEMGDGERLMGWRWSSRWSRTLKGFTFRAVTTLCNTDCMGGHGGFSSWH